MKLYSKGLHKILGVFVKLNEENNPEHRLATVEETRALLDEIERLQAGRRWIPISEPPKVKGEYICYSKPDIFTCFFGDSWDGGFAFRSVIQPTHWMPLPPPPESA